MKLSAEKLHNGKRYAIHMECSIEHAQGLLDAGIIDSFEPLVGTYAVSNELLAQLMAKDAIERAML